LSDIKVLLTRHLPDEVEAAFQEHFDVSLNPSDTPLADDQWRDALQNFDAICPTVTDNIHADLFQGISSPRTRILANFGVGFNHIALSAAGKLGISITNTPDVLTDATADLAMTILLMLARRAGEGERLVRSKQWSGWYPTQLLGTMVSGKTLGIIGMGRIGLATAQLASKGFGMKVLYHNRKPLHAEVQGDLQAEYCGSLEAMLSRCDYLSLHCPGGDATRHLLNADTLSLLPKHAFVINTSRGDVIDEDALIAALQNGAIAGAGLDVYAREPEIPASLLAMENVVLLPHLGSATLETRTAMGLRVLNNLKVFFAGDTPPDLVSPPGNPPGKQA